MQNRPADELCGKLKDAITSWQSEAADSQNQLTEQVKAVQASLESLVAFAATAGETTQARASEVLRDLSSLDESLSAGSDSLDSSNERIAELEQELVQERDATQAARQKLSELEETLAHHEAQAAQARVTELEQALSERVEAVQAAKQRIAQLEQNLAKHYEEINAAKSKEEEFDEIRARLESDLESMRDRTAELEKTLAEHDQSYGTQEAREAELEEVEKALREECDALRQQTVSASERDAAYREELESLRAELEKVRTAGSDSEKALRDECEALREQAVEEGKRAEEQTQQIASLQSELEQARGELAQAGANAGQLQTAQQQLEEVKKLLQVERDRAKDLEHQLQEETAKGTKANLATQLAEVLREHEATQTELATVQRELDQVRKESRATEAAAPAGATANTGESDTTLEEVTAAMNGQDREGRKRQLGDILLDAGTITQDQLQEALEEQRLSPQRHVGNILVEKGFTSEELVAQALACQCNTEFVSLRTERISPDVAAMITSRLAHLHSCIPVRATDDSLVLAMDNPLNLIAIEDIERATNRNVEPVVATSSDIRAAHDQYYATASESTI